MLLRVYASDGAGFFKVHIHDVSHRYPSDVKTLKAPHALKHPLSTFDGAGLFPLPNGPWKARCIPASERVSVIQHQVLQVHKGTNTTTHSSHQRAKLVHMTPAALFWTPLGKKRLRRAPVGVDWSIRFSKHPVRKVAAPAPVATPMCCAPTRTPDALLVHTPCSPSLYLFQHVSRRFC